MKILGTFVLSTALLTSAATGAWQVGTWWTGADPHRVVTGSAGWPAAVRTGYPPAPDPGSASPAQVARYFSRLTPARRTTLAQVAPAVVGNLDGAPDDLRYAANTAALGGAARPAGHLLGYDPRGDGRLIEVFGDLGAARHVAILVPGTGWDLHRLLATEPAGEQTPVTMAEALYAEMRRLDPVTPSAVVMWLGYDTPEGVDREAMRSGRAIAGARALVRFVAGLPAGTRVSAVCHSYGAVVCGRAVRAGARIEDLAVVAAPGLDTGSAAGLHTRARLWAARVPDDPIRFTPFVRFAGLGHGADPTGPRYGALVFRTGTAHGHGGYFEPGTESLTNLARIALGRAGEVTLDG
jgi:Alpha/beta hydrolase